PLKTVYVHLFSNDPKPSLIAERFKAQLKKFPVKFGYHAATESDNQDAFILEDLFSMMEFDCVIRAEANLSYIAAKLGKAKLEIYPVSGHWEGERKVIDKVEVVRK